MIFNFTASVFFHQSANYTVMILKLSLFWILESEQNKCALILTVILSTCISVTIRTINHYTPMLDQTRNSPNISLTCQIDRLTHSLKFSKTNMYV